MSAADTFAEGLKGCVELAPAGVLIKRLARPFETKFPCFSSSVMRGDAANYT
jgi:hypothetical protein